MSLMRSSPQSSRNRSQQTRRPGAIFAAISALLLIGILATSVFLSWRLLAFVDQIPTVANPVEDRTSPDQMVEFRQQANDRLNRQGWVDEGAGLAAIPIEQAMQLITSNTFPNNLNAKPTPSPTAQPTIPPTVAANPPAEPVATPTPDLANLTYADMFPIFDQHCAECHGPDNPEEGLEITSYRALMNGSLNGSVITRGDPDNSYLVQQITSGKMPKKRDPLSAAEIEIIVAWIKAGAPDGAPLGVAVSPVASSTQPTSTGTLSQTTPAKTTPAKTPAVGNKPISKPISGTSSLSSTASISTSISTSKAPTTTTPAPEASPSTTLTTTSTLDLTKVDLKNISFQAHVLPIFEQHCAKCHGDDNPEEGLELTSYRKLKNGSLNGAVIAAGDPDKSYLVQQITTGKMPKKGEPLTPAEIEIVVAWVKAGAKDN